MLNQENLKRGTAELIILHLLHFDDLYGYQITQEIENRSNGLYIMPEGSLYPILYRLVDKGCVSDRREVVGKRMRNYYHLEATGKEYYKELLNEYNNITVGIQTILSSEGGIET